MDAVGFPYLWMLWYNSPKHTVGLNHGWSGGI
jgi:hypothetical protein